MSNQLRIQRLAKYMSWFAAILTFALPFCYVVTCFDQGFLPQTLMGIAPSMPIQIKDLATWQLLIGFGLGAVPVLLVAWAFWEAYKFINLYRNANVFPAQASAILRRISKIFLGVALVSPLARIIASIVLSWHLGSGQRIIAVTLSSSDGFLILLSGLFLMISYILSEATFIADDHQQIV
jgi:hypothetical protein